MRLSEIHVSDSKNYVVLVSGADLFRLPEDVFWAGKESLRKLIAVDPDKEIGIHALNKATALANVNSAVGITWIGKLAFEDAYGIKIEGEDRPLLLTSSQAAAIVRAFMN